MKQKSSCPAIGAAILAWEIEQLEHRRLLSAPVLNSIADQTVPATRTLQVPLTATDADGNALHYTITSDNPNITAQLHPSTDTWLKLSTTQGTMLFELFNDIAPNTVSTITGLADAGFYNGLTFQRIARDKSGNPFIIQGGDPLGTGAGGPGFRFDDEFNENTIFDGVGQLAMANSGKDTNGSQFFVTDEPARYLDFNQTIWGQLVNGFGTLSKFFTVPVVSQNPSDPSAEISKPSVPQKIKSAAIVTDNTDGVLMVTAKTTGTATITVKVDDGQGGASTQTFEVNAVADSSNGTPNNEPPILGPVSNLTTPKDHTVSFKVTSIDPEGDPTEYDVQLSDTTEGSATVSGDVVTFKPRRNYTGPVTMFVGVRTPGAATRGSVQNPFDVEEIQIGVGDLPAHGSADSMTALAGLSSGKIAVAQFVDTDPHGHASDWSSVVTKDDLGDSVGGINWGDDTITNGTIIGNRDGSYSVVGSHAYANPGMYPITVTLEGNLGAKLVLQGTATVINFADEENGVLYVNGTSANDIISINASGAMFNVSLNGSVEALPAAGISRVDVEAGDGNDTVTIGSGVPAAYIDGGDGNDSLSGGDGNDTLTGGSGKNTMSGNDGDDRINGSGGRDVIFGGNGNDRLYGNGGDDILDGGGGVDHLFGGDGNDQLIGGGGNDKLEGDAGNDTLLGGAGSDSEDGGLGIDQAQQDGTDVLIGIESIL